jgi:uncharacterized membrane protein YvbJ
MYFSAFTGKHNCPNCNQISQLKHKSISRRIIYLSSIFLVGIIFILIIALVIKIEHPLIAGALVYFALLLPIDKNDDQKRKLLKKID